MFNLFTPPCFAAIGAMNSEMKSRKWLFGGIGRQLAVGYVLSFLVFFFGTVFTKGSLGSIWMPITGWLVVLIIVAIIAYLIIRRQRTVLNK